MDKHVFRMVAGVHVAALLLLLSWGCVSRWLAPTPPLAIPVEFIVDVTPSAPGHDAPSFSEPEPEPPPSDRIPEPTIVPPPPKPKPERPKIEVSRKPVVRTVGESAPRPNPLTEEDIRKLLAAGATAGDRTLIPDEDSRGLALIKTTLDALWQKPSKAAAGDAEAFLRLWIEADGRVGKTELTRRSGNPELDASVDAVGRQVRRIHGLSSDFIHRRSPVTVAFTVQ